MAYGRSLHEIQSAYHPLNSEVKEHLMCRLMMRTLVAEL